MHFSIGGFSQAHTPQQGLWRGGETGAAQPSQHLHCLLSRHEVEELRCLDHRPHFPTQARVVAGSPLEYADTPGVGPHQARNDPEESALTRAVLSQDSIHPALRNADGEVIQRDHRFCRHP